MNMTRRSRSRATENDLVSWILSGPGVRRLLRRRSLAQPPDGGPLADRARGAATVGLFEEQRPDQVAAQADRRPGRGGHGAGLRRRPRGGLGNGRCRRRTDRDQGQPTDDEAGVPVGRRPQAAGHARRPGRSDRPGPVARRCQESHADRVGRRARRAGEPRGGHRPRRRPLDDRRDQRRAASRCPARTAATRSMAGWGSAWDRRARARRSRACRRTAPPRRPG